MSTNVAKPTSGSYTRSYEACFEKDSTLPKDDVVYIEMHATGTLGGDKAELNSIKGFYCQGREYEVVSLPLWLGGNKSKFGHTEPVSGLLSLAKSLMSFQKEVMPATMLMTDPASALQDMKAFNVHLATFPLKLDSLRQGLFCATSSGMSGTTTHVVLSQAVPSQCISVGEVCPLPHLMVLNTHSKEAAATWCARFANACPHGFLTRDQIVPRDGLFHRGRAPAAVVTLAAFGDSTSLANLSEMPPIINPPPVVPKSIGKAAVVVAFGGVGSVQYGVARRAYLCWPSFRHAVNYIE